MIETFESIRSSALNGNRNANQASILEKETSALLGVSQEAAKALKDIGLTTVFDLATSSLFADAVAIRLLADSKQGRFAAYSKVPRDVLRSDYDTPISELPLKDISILKGQTTEPRLKALAIAIDVATIRDLAAWPPYQTARELLDRAYNSMAITGADPESPADLIPANGQFPTERVQYEVLLFDQFYSEDKELPPLTKHTPLKTPLDITTLLKEDTGYEQPAIGSILTFSQSWYTKGLALGSLIHGVSLAPGESTKIAMIDWARKVETSVTEAIDQGEDLNSDLVRTRSINEITNAVAMETQSGGSNATNFSTASQHGESSGTSGLNIGVSIPVVTGVSSKGTSDSTSSGFTNAKSWSTSSGHREISASLAQDIMDRTHQASHSARNRRASIVKEMSQKESESITTRTVTNYNHMHSLTIEYYEVVQLYRTVVELTKADRCLFVPMKLVDFTQPGIIDRFRQVIAANGLRPEVQVWAVAEAKNLMFSSPRRNGTWNSKNDPQVGTNPGSPTDRALFIPESAPFGDIFFDINAPFDSLMMTLASGETVSIPLFAGPSQQDILASGGSDTINDEYLLGLHTMNGGMHTSPVDLDYTPGKIFGRPADEVRRIEAKKKEKSSDFSGTVTVNLIVVKHYIYNDPDPCLSWSIDVEAKSPTVILFEVQPTVTTNELLQHLKNYQLYYSQAIWRSLSPTNVGILLSGYTLKLDGQQEKPLVELVDPSPVAIVANYLVLRISGDDQATKEDYFTNKKIIMGEQHEDVVPVPSGGVFAEAVLGRFNSAEKLDITRFWNWQDSPIPVQAPDIAPTQASMPKSEQDNTMPSQLGAPVLNIVNPPSLPDPQGLGAILQAIQNGNIFRDMSGLAATIGLAQAGLQAAQQGATSAGAQAGQNAATAAQLGAKVVELAGQLAAAYLTGGTSLAAGAGAKGLAGLVAGISGQGAKINQGRNMDMRAASNSSGRGQPMIGQTAGGGGLASSSSPDIGMAGSSAKMSLSSASDGRFESEAFDASVGVAADGASSNRLSYGTTPSGDIVYPAVAPAVAAAAGALTELGTYVSKKIIDGYFTSSKKPPEVIMDLLKDGLILLQGYEDPLNYIDGYSFRGFGDPTCEIDINFENLGGTELTDGFRGNLHVSWVDGLVLDPDALKQKDRKFERDLISIFCKSNILVLPTGTAGKSISKSLIKLDLLSTRLPPKVPISSKVQNTVDVDSQLLISITIEFPDDVTWIDTVKVPISRLYDRQTFKVTHAIAGRGKYFMLVYPKLDSTITL